MNAGGLQGLAKSLSRLPVVATYPIPHTLTEAFPGLRRGCLDMVDFCSRLHRDVLVRGLPSFQLVDLRLHLLE